MKHEGYRAPTIRPVVKTLKASEHTQSSLSEKHLVCQWSRKKEGNWELISYIATFHSQTRSAWMSEVSRLCGVMPPGHPQKVSEPILPTAQWAGGSWSRCRAPWQPSVVPFGSVGGTRAQLLSEPSAGLTMGVAEAMPTSVEVSKINPKRIERTAFTKYLRPEHECDIY